MNKAMILGLELYLILVESYRIANELWYRGPGAQPLGDIPMKQKFYVLNDI